MCFFNMSAFKKIPEERAYFLSTKRSLNMGQFSKPRSNLLVSFRNIELYILITPLPPTGTFFAKLSLEGG